MTRTYAPLAILFAAALGAALFLGDRMAREVEAETANRAAAALSVGGHFWARADTDGVEVGLSGEAFSEAQRADALAAIREAAPWAAINDGSTVRPPQPAFHPSARLEVLRGLADLVVTGAAPDAGTLDALEAGVRRAAPRLPVSVFARDDAGSADLKTLAEAAGDVAVRLLHGRIVITPGVMDVAGLSQDEEALAEIESLLMALSDAGFEVRRDLIAPPPRPTAFALRAVMDATGGALTECAAPSLEEAARLLSEAAQLFLDTPGVCRIGGGAPDDNWIEASLAAMRVVAGLPAGRISLVGRRARLTAAPPTRFRQIEDARGALGQSLPEGYRLAVLADPAAVISPSEDDLNAAVTDEGAPDQAPSLSARAAMSAETVLTLDGGVLTLSGAAPTDALAAAAAGFARARLVGVDVENDLSALSGAGGFGLGGAPGWRAAMTTTLSLLGQLQAGEARLTTRSLTVSGAVADPLEIPALHRLAVTAAGDDRRAITRLSVPVAARAAAAPTPVAECALRLNEIVAERPITFEPGSTQIDEAGKAVIGALAAALRPCQGGRVEIGGHTDSQGSARLNLGISQARAFAVLDALVEAGVAPLRLSARGYGEEQPVADNGTEEGRARNRRIEFTAAPDREEGE